MFWVDLEGVMAILGTWNSGAQNTVCQKQVLQNGILICFTM